MKFSIIVVVATLIFAFAGHFLLEDPGYVAINFRGYLVEMSVPVLLGIAAALIFAVWAIRRDATPQEKKAVEHGLIKTLGMNHNRLERIAQESSQTLGLPAADLHTYLSSFIYRLGQVEEAGIARFRELVDEHHLL